MWQLAYEPSVVPRPIKYIRPPKERILTPAERRSDREVEIIHGMAPGGRDRDSAAIDPEEAWFRHKNWSGKRMLVIAAMDKAGTPGRTLGNVINCGAECVIEWSESERRHRVRGTYCKCRHCEPCMRSKAMLLARNLEARLTAKPDAAYRFVTLTLKHNRCPLLDQIKRLYRSYAALRRLPLWRQSQDGGAAMLEVKWSAASREWHPHLHLVCEGRYLDARALSRAWEQITGDSRIVDIRQISKGRDAAYYVAKYVSKGTSDAVWSHMPAAIEWVVATRGVRMCATFGSWRGYKLLAKPPTAPDWTPIALLSRVAAEAKAGIVASIYLLESLRESYQYDPHRRRSRGPAPPSLPYT